MTTTARRTSRRAARPHDNGYRDGLKRGEQAARAGKRVRHRSASGITATPRTATTAPSAIGTATATTIAAASRRATATATAGATAAPSIRTAYPSAYPGNGRGYGYGGTASYGAFQNGAGDGYQKGVDDIEDRKSPDATRHKWYRSGDRDYDNALRIEGRLQDRVPARLRGRVQPRLPRRAALGQVNHLRRRNRFIRVRSVVAATVTAPDAAFLA